MDSSDTSVDYNLDKLIEWIKTNLPGIKSLENVKRA
jgi:hypothetical protein